MSEGIAARQRERARRASCRHHWIIETPHGVTSRGHCKRCGASKRFPNAAEDALWEGASAGLGRWSARRGVSRPAEISIKRNEGNDD
jgi:hypothetical protein